MLFSNIDKIDLSDYSMISKALSFLRNNDVDMLPLGKTLGSNDSFYCQKLEYMTENIEQTPFEIHQHFLDLHYIVDGTEKIDISLNPVVKVDEVTTENKDIQFVENPDTFNRVTLHKGDFLLIGMNEPHRTNGQVTSQPSFVSKIVLKLATKGVKFHENA